MQSRSIGSGVLFLAALAARADWLDAVSAEQAEQPHWVTPLVTVTPRLEQEYRVDDLDTRLASGAWANNLGNGKGLELIAPGLPVELAVSGPGYISSTDVHHHQGYTDSSFLLKWRLCAAPEGEGNYIVTAFIGGSLPTGSAYLGNAAAIYTPTLAVGKGWGPWALQSTLGYTLPVTAVNRLGHSLLSNTSLQWQVGSFWPELEYNQTTYRDGPWSGQRQGLATAGILWRHPLRRRIGLVLGLGYQKPVTRFSTQDRTLIATARLPF